jgi:hypothetical protein
MTFKIEVDMDWIGEDESIDDVIKDRIASSIIKTVSEKAIRDIETKVDNMINATVLEKINAKMEELLQDFLTRPRTITDKYGDKIKSDVSVMDLLKERCDQFIEGDVDSNGNAVEKGHYGKKMSRIDYLVEKNITFSMERSIKTAAEQIRIAMQKYVDETLTKQIGENVAKIIGLDKLAAKI